MDGAWCKKRTDYGEKQKDTVKIWDYFEKIINKNVEKGRIKE